MARKEGVRIERRQLFTVRFVTRLSLGAIVIVGALYAWHRTEQFLITDARFAMAMPDFGIESPSLEITGVQYASRIQVLRVFAPDYGRSLYMLPLKQRREQLRALDWVRDASIARIWPNRVIIHIQEREPVAFMHVPTERPNLSRVALIDSDGMILQPPPTARFNLPVAIGIRHDEPIMTRRSRVRRLMTLMKDVGEMGQRISEVDVAELDNLKVTAKAGNRGVLLLLGDRNFAKRLENFVNYYPKIQERLANATLVDMRLEERITVVEGSGK